MTKPTYLVVGGTGTIGRLVVRQLLDGGQSVRTLVRSRAKAAEFAGRAEIIEGDLTKPETLPRAFAGVDKAFILAPPTPDLVALETAAFDAAKAASVRHIVYLSNFGAGEIGSPDTIWHWHGVSERRLRDLGLAWTILRPARFMSDAPFPWMWDQEKGVFSEPLGHGKVIMIAPQDVAAVAVKVLTTQGHEGRVYELTSSEALGGSEIADALTTIGKSTKFADVSIESVRESTLSLGFPSFLVDIVEEYFTSLRAGRWHVTSTTADLLARRPLTYLEWLKGQAIAAASKV
jgi:uncharacterized protein YbjT (DUF2867 family)